MGYSVLIPLNKSEQEKVRKFLRKLTDQGLIGPATAEPDGTAKADSLFGRYTSDPRMERLSYKGKHKTGTYVGCDYGDHDIAHTFANWMAKTLGKTHYVYDGDETLKVRDKKIIETNLLIRKSRGYCPEKLWQIARFLKADTIPTETEWAAQELERAKFRREYRKNLFKLVNTLQKVWNQTHA